jgi:hypothetical protein
MSTAAFKNHQQTLSKALFKCSPLAPAAGHNRATHRPPSRHPLALQPLPKSASQAWYTPSPTTLLHAHPRQNVSGSHHPPSLAPLALSCPTLLVTTCVQTHRAATMLVVRHARSHRLRLLAHTNPRIPLASHHTRACLPWYAHSPASACARSHPYHPRVPHPSLCTLALTESLTLTAHMSSCLRPRPPLLLPTGSTQAQRQYNTRMIVHRTVAGPELGHPRP